MFDSSPDPGRLPVRAPLVTLAIPFHNPGPYFRIALQSVFAQSFTDWELLLIDDGGSDGSLQLARSLNDPRVRVYSDGENLRLARRLNEAAHLARGKYLFRMDADDIMHPERVASQLKALEAAPANAVVGTAAYSIGADSQVVGLRPAPARQQAGYAARESFVHPTVAASTEWFRANPYSEEAIFSRCEDAELWCRTAGTSEFRWIGEPLLFYREMGVFNLRNYVWGVKGLLEVIDRSVPGVVERERLKAELRAKILAARLLNAAGASDVMVRGRYRQLPPAELESANRILLKAAQTPLPGDGGTPTI